ncbi:MAG: hypothetical protein FWF92_06815 [Oscillospiraceae bacterium]|nr:hypothetical protein [Oscillospiraceae bacterium]
MDNKQWLLENGGPAIQLRMVALKNTNSVENNSENAVLALLDIDGVHLILNKFDGFQTSDRDKKTLEHLIHYYKDTCIERFFPLVMDLGFRVGIQIFDEKMESVADIFKFLYAYADEDGNCHNYSLMLHQHFFMSGYLFPEVVESMENRINALHKAAKEKVFDVYQDESELPKKPEIWTDYGVLKDAMNPWNRTAEKPLPMWYDILALAYYADKCADPENAKKINDIVEYIIDPEFQRLPREALLYVKARRMYHAGGFGVTLPLYKTDEHTVPSNLSAAFEILDIMSHFEMARKSKWFGSCLNYLEQFKTETGTYIFPKEYLNKKYIDKAFLNKTNMSLKGDEREQMKRELISTMKMTEIYNRIL